MATTQSTYTGNNSTTDYSFTFPYIKEADVKVSLDSVVKTQDTDYTFANATTISFGSAPGTGVAIRIFRDTDTENPVTTFFAGSAIRAQDLNDNSNQVLYSAQERVNRDLNKTGDTMTGELILDDTNLVIQEGSDKTTISAPALTANRTVTIPDQSGTVPLLAASSNTQVTATPEELNKLDGYTGDHTDINKIDGVTDGTVSASKAVVVDANKDVTGFRNVTATGEIAGATGTFSSNVSVATPTADGHAATKAYVDGVALAAIPDSDKGDISVTGSGTTWTIDNDAVTYAKMQNVSATDRLLGRDTAGAGDVEEITPANVRTMLNVADGANAYSHPNHSGDVTSSGDGATTIANDAVTYAKLQNVAANSILGNNTGSAADAIELTATQVRALAAAAGTGTVNTFGRTQSVTPEVEATGAIDFTQSNFIELGTGDYSSATVTQTVIGTSGLLYCDTAAPSALPAVLKHPAGTYTAPTTFPAVAPWYQAETDEILVGSWTQGIA
jgi:hypothetical protein